MTRVILLVTLFLLISINGLGQCVNPPTIKPGSTIGSTCGRTPVTVSGNTFGGSATRVDIKDNGHGSVSPSTARTSPFTFTYTPGKGDSGEKVTITLTTNNPSGPCVAAVATYTLTVNEIPSAPVIGTITKPTCTVATGSVVLRDLPSNGTWTLTRTPGGVTTTGKGTTTTISGLEAGTYTYTVSGSTECSSEESEKVVINAQPASPASPVQTIDCTLGYGLAVVRVTGPTGTGLQYRLDDGAYRSGTTFTNVADGNHTITVRNSSGCTTTGTGFTVSCGCINPPEVTLSSKSGSICGTAPVTVSGNTFGGSATNVTITENGAGTVSPATTGTTPFAFTYTPAAGDADKTVIITVKTDNPSGVRCVPATTSFTLTVKTIPEAPSVSNATPGNICPAETIDLTTLVTSVTPNGGSILFKTTNNPLGTDVANPKEVETGTYYIFYKNKDGCYSTGKEVIATITICSPDVTPTLFVSPNIMHGITNFEILIEVTELDMVNTNGLITVNIPKDSRWYLTDGFIQSLAIMGTKSLNNSAWTYSSDAINHIFTSGSVIQAGDVSVFGFRVTFDPGNTKGIFPITSQLLSGSGGEIRVTNNCDSEKIDYFPQ